MTYTITVEWISGAELAGEDDEARAIYAAKSYFEQTGLDALACQAEWRRQADTGRPPSQLEGLAAIFHCAERLADQVATQHWDCPDAGTLLIRVVEAPPLPPPTVHGPYDATDMRPWNSSFRPGDKFPQLNALDDGENAYIPMLVEGELVMPAVLVNRQFAGLIPLIEAAPSLHELLVDVLALFEKWRGIEGGHPVGIHACAVLIRQKLNQITPFAGQPSPPTG